MDFTVREKSPAERIASYKERYNNKIKESFALADELPEIILLFLGHIKQSATRTQISNAIGTDPLSLCRHLAKLEHEHKIKSLKDAHHVYYYLYDTPFV